MPGPGGQHEEAAMRQFGFEHVMEIGLSSGDDLHYPNLKAEWFSQQALPFLDNFSKGLAVTGFERTPEAGTYLLTPWDSK